MSQLAREHPDDWQERLESGHVIPESFTSRPACTCKIGAEYDSWNDCPIHVSCDDNCQALVQPMTIEELQAALEHWKSHGRLSGCSHGC